MPTHIKCPNCGHEFDIEDVLSADLEKKYHAEYQSKLSQSLQIIEIEKQKLIEDQKVFEEKKKNENELFLKKIEDAKQKMMVEIRDEENKKISADFESKIILLQKSDLEKEEKLKLARIKEMEFLEKEEKLKVREQELALETKKIIIAERENARAQFLVEEKERTSILEQEYLFKFKEMEQKLEAQQKLAEEMRRKADQGSMQSQGETQELLLEQTLSSCFPYDQITEVGKGVKGADCIQIVKTQTGVEAGKIIYESKRTKDFSNDWIEKLKADMRSSGAEVAVIVTQAFPKDMDRFGEKNGVYICSFSEVKSVALLLRNALLKVFEARKSQENKGDKMVMLYDYLIGSEFVEQWKAISEGFRDMQKSIQTERNAMEKLWKAREKQLEKVLLNAAHIKGSIEGIAGADAVNLSLTDEPETPLLD